MNTLRIALFALLLGACAVIIDLLVLGGHIPSTVLPSSIWNLSLILEMIACGILGFIVFSRFGGRTFIILSLLVGLVAVSEMVYYSNPILLLLLCSWFVGGIL